MSRNGALVDIMMQRFQVLPDVEQFEQFCAILEKASEFGPLVKSMRTQMSIYSCRESIEESVDLNSLVPLLESDNVLTSRDVQTLSAASEQEKMLLTCMDSKDADKWSGFMHCLERSGQNSLVRKIHLNANKVKFNSRDSGFFSPMTTPIGGRNPLAPMHPSSPMTSIQETTDLIDGISKLAITKEEGLCDLNYIHGKIEEELRELDDQYKEVLERMERHYTDIQLMIETKRSEHKQLLGELHQRQKEDLKNLKRKIRRGKGDKTQENWLSALAKPDAYMKIETDRVAVDQIKQWDTPVIVGSAHHSTTTAQGIGLKWAYTNKVALFTVEFRDIQGQPLITKSVEDMMDLTSHFDCAVIDSKNSLVPITKQIVPPSSEWVSGIMSITYMPTVTGYLDISVKCGGHPITRSPFKVLVYPLSEYYGLMTTPQEILSIRETITGLSVTSSGDAAICTEIGNLLILKRVVGGYYRVDVAAYHGGLSLKFPLGVSCDSSDNLVVANTRNSQLVKASSPDVKEKLLKSRELNFEPTCVAAHDRMIAAGGSRDVVICDHNLDVLHTVSFSSSLSALTIANNLTIHVAISDNKHNNYACIENIDSKEYQTRFAQLLPAKTASSKYRINDIVTDEEHNIIVCYTAQPLVAMFKPNGDLLYDYGNWGSEWSTEFAAVAVSRNSGLLLVDQTKNKLFESHLQEYNMSSLEDIDRLY